MLKFPAYAEVIDRALMVENDWEEDKNSKYGQKKRQYFEQQSYLSTKPNLGPTSGTSQRSTTPQLCQSCQKVHWGQCHKSFGACYRCGHMGYLIKECPRIHKGNNASTSTPNSA